MVRRARAKPTLSLPEAARRLARDHARMDRTIEQVWHFEDPASRVLRLIEVSRAELPAENGAVVTARFGPSDRLPFASEIGLLSRKDWARVRRGDLALPPGWDLARARNLVGRGR